MSSRILTVSGLYVSPSSKSSVPAVRLQGKWLGRLGFGIGDKVVVYGERQVIVIAPAKETAEKTAFHTPYGKELADTRDELDRLIEVRESLSALILEVSERLDLLVYLEHSDDTDEPGILEIWMEKRLGLSVSGHTGDTDGGES